MDWDTGAVTYSNQDLAAGNDDGSVAVTRQSIKQRFREFIRNFRRGNNFVYRNQLLQRWRKRDFHLNIDLQDVLSYDSELNDVIQRSPNEYVPLFEAAAKDALTRLIVDLPSEEELPDLQIMLTSDQGSTSMRGLDAADVNRLMQVQGIITSASKTRAKATAITVRCRSCSSTKVGGTVGIEEPCECQKRRMSLGGVRSIVGHLFLQSWAGGPYFSPLPHLSLLPSRLPQPCTVSAATITLAGQCCDGPPSRSSLKQDHALNP